jgi:integrase
MAITKRGRSYHIRFRPFGREVIGLKIAARSKTEAKQIEMALLTACRSGDYRGLDPVSREGCVRMFRNQGWELPPELEQIKPVAELTLWKAAEMFLKYPGIKDSPTRWRYECSLVHLVEKLGKDTPVKSIWVPGLKKYQIDRQHGGAAPDTVNRELSTLSRLFGVLIEMQLMESNPCRLIKRLSTKSGERQVYLSLETVQAIADSCPAWYQPMLWTAYSTGMRRGEILGLTRRQVDVERRIIKLSPGETKEAQWKRVPIHRDLVSILRAVLEGPALMNGKVFSLRDGRGIRELGLETFKNVWPRACKALKLAGPRFHDLRATWKTNARRSGVHPEIEMAIMGHSERGRSVHERYGRISDRELLDAIDQMTFDHGLTEVFVAGR